MTFRRAKAVRFLTEKIMRRTLRTCFFFGFLGIALFGCSSADNTTNRAQTNANNRNMNSMNMNSTSTTSAPTNVNSNTAAFVQDKFWTEAAQGGMAEVELAKLALQKSQNADVKKFAQTMVTDHSKANDELKALAAKKNVVLPTDIGSHKSTLDDLSKKSGADFDKAYVEAMVDDHQEDVDFFDDHTKSSDADIKAFATKTLPVIKSHLEMIKGIQSKMK